MEQPTDVASIEPSDESPNRTFLAVPWTKRDIFWVIVLGVFVLLGLLLCLVLGMTLFSLVTGTELSASLLATLVLVAELGLMLPVWALGVHKYRLPWNSVGFRRFHLGRGLGLGCLFLLIAFGFNFVWAVILGVFDLRVQPDILPLFGGGIAGLLLALLAGGLVAPLAEEVFFRGYVFAGLRQHFGFLPAVLLSSGLFALVHILPTSWPPIFVLGVLFALLYERTGSIWPAVVVHGVINALSFLAAYLFQVLGS